MSAPTPMTREELLELAPLDAFGMLDEYEAALFTRSFHHAPAAVQDEVKSLQASTAGDVAMLPDVEPRPALRGKVLAAVTGAIEAEMEGLAPLAMIGRPPRQRKDTVGRIGFGTHDHFWRAASLVLAGVALVLSYFSLQIYERNTALTDMVIDLVPTPGLVAPGTGMDVLSIVQDPSSRRITLRPIGEDRGESALIVVNEQTDEAFLCTFAMPAPAKFILVARVEGREEPEFRRSFSTRNAIGAVRLGEFSTAQASRLTWEIRDLDDNVIMRSA